ncbi:hypothetical protein ACFQX6_29815 [Streptosporangium lutulentum]
MTSTSETGTVGVASPVRTTGTAAGPPAKRRSGGGSATGCSRATPG